MAKPIIKQITPFDASTVASVNFVWTGSMAYNNRMVIYDANTMTVVYDHVYSTNYYRLSHEIPAGTLENGKKYAVAIAVIDVNKMESDFSEKYYFWVSATPTFYLDGLSETEPLLVDSPSYTAQLVYSQPNGVAIDTYQFFLYNSVKEQLDASDVYRGSNSSFKYIYKSLDSNMVYYVRATGSTIQGVSMDTGYLPINVKYQEPSLYALFYAVPNPVIGTVDYYSNIIDIESDLPSDSYKFKDGYIDLTSSPTSVRYSHNFTIPRNATISVMMKRLNKTCNILKAQSKGSNVWLLQSLLDEESNAFRFKLIVYGNTSNYIIYSKSLECTTYDIITVHIRRINGIYELYPFVTENSKFVVREQWFDSDDEKLSNDEYLFASDVAHKKTLFVKNG